jgi:signal transduction histidine kinase
MAKLGLGPATLRERIASLEGKLTVQSAPTGTTLEIVLPFRKEGA